MTHHSKVDVYILAAIALAVVVFLLGDYWIAGPVLLVLLLCAYPQSYETTPRGLVIRTAVGRQVIPYQAISYIGPASEENEGSEPKNRVLIQYGPAGEVVIVPSNGNAFLADMARHTPHLIKRGQRLFAVFA